MRQTKVINFDDFSVPDLDFQIEGNKKSTTRNVKLQTP